MVEYTLNLDSIFGSLSDPTRRDILKRLLAGALTVSEVAKPYNVSFAAVSKHLKVLEKASLITKQRRGKEQIVSVSPTALKEAEEYLEQYRQLWESRYNKLEKLLQEEVIHGQNQGN